MTVYEFLESLAQNHAKCIDPRLSRIHLEVDYGGENTYERDDTIEGHKVHWCSVKALITDYAVSLRIGVVLVNITLE